MKYDSLSKYELLEYVYKRDNLINNIENKLPKKINILNIIQLIKIINQIILLIKNFKNGN
jgi:hypothetical protein